MDYHEQGMAGLRDLMDRACVWISDSTCRAAAP